MLVFLLQLGVRWELYDFSEMLARESFTCVDLIAGLGHNCNALGQKDLKYQ